MLNHMIKQIFNKFSYLSLIIVPIFKSSHKYATPPIIRFHVVYKQFPGIFTFQFIFFYKKLTALGEREGKYVWRTNEVCEYCVML